MGKETVIKETEYNALYEKWRYTVMRTYIYGWAIVTLIELGMGVMLEKLGIGVFDLQWIMKYCAFPAGVNFVIIMVTFVCMGSKKISSNTKNWIIIIMMSLIAFILASVHNYFPGIYMIFLAPVFASAIFSDKKITISIGVLCVILIPVSVYFAVFYEPDFELLTHLLNAAVAAVVVVIATMVSVVMVLLNRDRESVITEVTEANVKLAKEAKFDGLTGILNHTSFYTELDKSIAELNNSGTVFSLAMIDIDNFKKVNDTCGHNIGDNILRSVANILTDQMGNDGIVFRYGGDEFAVILNGYNTRRTEHMIDQARRTIATEKYSYLPEGIVVRISAGIYEVKDAAISAEQAFYRADQALYEAKFNGKNQIVTGNVNI